MAWTSPRTWVSGEVLTAALLNQQVRDNELVLSTHVHSGTAGDGGKLPNVQFGTGPTAATASGVIAGLFNISPVPPSTGLMVELNGLITFKDAVNLIYAWSEPTAINIDGFVKLSKISSGITSPIMLVDHVTATDQHTFTVTATGDYMLEAQALVHTSAAIDSLDFRLGPQSGGSSGIVLASGARISYTYCS